MNSGRDAPPTHTVVPASSDTPTHAVRIGRSQPFSPSQFRGKRLAAAIGLVAALAAIGVGTEALVTSGNEVSSNPTSANLITVGPRVPLSPQQLSALVGKVPNFGALTDAKKRASCLKGLGYPASMQVLGAEPIQINGSAAIVLVMPGDRPTELIALAVSPNCRTASTGLIADTTVTRP